MKVMPLHLKYDSEVPVCLNKFLNVLFVWIDKAFLLGLLELFLGLLKLVFEF